MLSYNCGSIKKFPSVWRMISPIILLQIISYDS